jgi:hypothetical protein
MLLLVAQSLEVEVDEVVMVGTFLSDFEMVNVLDDSLPMVSIAVTINVFSSSASMFGINV